MRVEGGDLCRGAQVGHRVRDALCRQRAHVAEVLGEDEIGVLGSQCRLVELVEVGAGGDVLPHQSVHLTGGESFGLQTADHHGVVQPGPGWHVALERHRHQIVTESELIDDLGRRGQQGGDAHATR